MERQVTIDDTLEERVQTAKDELKNLLTEYLEQNDVDDLPCLNNDIDYDGRFHEMVDSNVPIYTSEINDTWYLYKNALEKAYDDAGVGEDSLENNGMSAIYFYIQQECNEWWNNNAQDVFDEWKEENEDDSTEETN
jgi:hypothetical protein